MPKMIEETRKVSVERKGDQQEAFLSKPHTFLDIKLDPEDQYSLIISNDCSEVFYKIGRTMTNQQRKQDREKAAKAAAEAEAKAQKKKGSEKGGKKTSEKDSKKEKANKASKTAMKETEQTSMSA